MDRGRERNKDQAQYDQGSSQGSRSRAKKAAVMSESLVEASDVEETVTEVLAQLVRDGGEQAQISVERLQKQVELHLEY